MTPHELSTELQRQQLLLLDAVSRAWSAEQQLVELQRDYDALDADYHALQDEMPADVLQDFLNNHNN